MEITKTDKDGISVSSKSIDVALNSVNKKADVALFTSPHDQQDVGDAIVFDSPGEYEAKNCMIDAVALDGDNTGYSVYADEIRVAFLQGVSKPLSDSQVEGFAAVDVLIVPIIGDKAEVTTKIINQIEPKVVIPHTYSPEELKAFTAEFGNEQETVSKVKLSKKELADSEQQRLIVLE